MVHQDTDSVQNCVRASSGGRDAVSVVIPTCDRPRLLRRTLATVLAQKSVEMQVLVIDDGASDPATPAVRDAADDRVQLVTTSGRTGLSNARNVGIEHADGAWVAFCDDDDLWAADKLANQLTAVTQDGAGWAASACVVVDHNLEPRFLDRGPGGMPGLADLLRGNCVPGSGSSVMAATALLRETGGFDTGLHFAEDWDLWIRLAQRSPLAISTALGVAQVMHPVQMSRSPAGLIDVARRVERVYRADAARLGVGCVDDRWLTSWVVERATSGGHRRWAFSQAARYTWRHRGRQEAVRLLLLPLLPEPVRVRRRRSAFWRGLELSSAAEVHAFLTYLQRVPADGARTGTNP